MDSRHGVKCSSVPKCMTHQLLDARTHGHKRYTYINMILSILKKKKKHDTGQATLGVI